MSRRPPRSTLFPTRRSSDLAMGLTTSGEFLDDHTLEAVADAEAGVADGRIDVPRIPDGELQVPPGTRSEEHTSELQSLRHLVCRLLLEKKKKNRTPRH